jgi:hypothetical protein
MKKTSHRRCIINTGAVVRGSNLCIQIVCRETRDTDLAASELRQRMEVVRSLALARVVMTINKIILGICHRLEERRENLVGVTTELDDRGSIPGGTRNFSLLHSIQERLWSPTSLLSNRYLALFLLRLKRPGREADLTPPYTLIKHWNSVAFLPYIALSSFKNHWCVYIVSCKGGKFHTQLKLLKS